MDEDDNLRVQKYRAGETESFGLLYDKYVRKIYRYVYYKVFDKEAVEDIVSDVFLKALKKIQSFDSVKGSFSAWIYRIARNSVIDYYRTLKQTRDIEDIFDLGFDERGAERLDAEVTLKKVSEYLKTLSPKQREIVVLRVWEEMPYRQIAEIVGGSEESVKMAFSRAVRNIREKFGPLGAAAFLMIIGW